LNLKQKLYSLYLVATNKPRRIQSQESGLWL